MSAKPTLLIDPNLDPPPVRPALVWAKGLPGCPATNGAPLYLTELVARVRLAGASCLPPERKAAVRDMLRHGVYKPAGRAKPSSEYLLAAALEGEGPLGAFPLVNGPVDANNAVSLEWGFPASVFDAALAGPELLLRRGMPGESYVFNNAAQRIDLEDLLLVCRRAPGSGPAPAPVAVQGCVQTEAGGDGAGGADGEAGSWEPCGNPVKDSVATKVHEGCRDVLAVVYAPSSVPASEVEACAARFAALLKDPCGAANSGYAIIGTD
jgi:DNA/RNA-binding domain of Phe-tRNA-synthetase-like protein